MKYAAIETPRGVRCRVLEGGSGHPLVHRCLGELQTPDPVDELVEQLENACSALHAVVEFEVEHRDALQPEPLPELVADERHRPAERSERLIALIGLADDADRYPGMAKIRGGLQP